MIGLRLLLLLVPCVTPACGDPVEVIAVVRVRNVYGGKAQPALRIEVEEAGRTRYYWYDIPGRRWYVSEQVQPVVRQVVPASQVPRSVQRARRLLR